MEDQTTKIIFRQNAIRLKISKNIHMIPYSSIRSIGYDEAYENCNLWADCYNYTFKYPIELYNELCDKYNDWLNKIYDKTCRSKPDLL